MSHAPNKGHETHPMAPPRVSGVSLAPLPAADCLAAVSGASGPEAGEGNAPVLHQRKVSQTRLPDLPAEGAKPPARRQPVVRIVAPVATQQRPAAEAGPACARGEASGAPSKGAAASTTAAEPPQLMAEGRAVSLMRPHLEYPGSPDSSDQSSDLILAQYREINVADSLWCVLGWRSRCTAVMLCLCAIVMRDSNTPSYVADTAAYPAVCPKMAMQSQQRQEWLEAVCEVAVNICTCL